MSTRTYSVSEAFDLLCRLYKVQLHYMNKDLYEEVRVPYLCGPPGTGKTSLTKVIARHLQLPYKRIDMSSYEYYELKGLLYVNEYTMTSTIVELDLIPTSPCVLCIDEINAADFSLQKVLANLVYERQIVNRRLHDQTFIICCGNPVDTVEGMYDLLSHLKDRLLELHLQPTFDELLCRIAKISGIAYDIYRTNYEIVKRWFLQRKSMRQLTAASYPLEQYIKTKDERWLEVVKLYLGDLINELIFQVEKPNQINSFHDLLSIVINIDQYTSHELQQLHFDKNIMFNVQQYCKLFNLLDKWEKFLLKLNEEQRNEIARWLVGVD